MTTPDTPAKKIVSVEILHLDELGYGPEGKHTRRVWRAECLHYFEQGAAAFLAWQQSWQDLAEQNQFRAVFGMLRAFDDKDREVNSSFSLILQSHSLDFAGHIFENDVVAKGCQFLNDVFFDKAIFKGRAIFTEAIFKGAAYFTDSAFAKYAKFNSTTFASNANFTYTTFTANALFGGASFKCGAMFTSCTFTGNVRFDYAKFEDGTDFTKAIFTDDANFTKAYFKGGVLFIYAYFEGGADFSESTFTSEVHFREATFKGRAIFIDTEFKGSAVFAKTAFTGEVHFCEASFTGYADFSGITCESNADFGTVDFDKKANFLKAKFHNQTNFRDAKFKENADFENAEFANVGHFEGAKFNAEHSEIPSFRGVDVGSTLLEFSDDTHFTQTDFDEEAIKNISFLKHLSEQHGQIDQALNFNAMELRAKYLQVVEPLRAQDFSLLKRLFKRYFSCAWWALRLTWFYGLVSDFGRSYMRPLVSYLIVYLFCFTVAVGIAAAHKPQNCRYTHEVLSLMCDGRPQNEDEKLYLDGYQAAFEYANYHSTGLVDFTGDSKLKDAITQRLFDDSVKPWWVRLIGALLSIINTVLLFLIALGLRNSYRLK